MRQASTAAAGPDTKSNQVSLEIQAEIRAELEAMLAAPIFVQSGRCKKFLSFTVEQALAGNAHYLKERTIGVKVFERASDYDTGDDSIVRVTANEVRKRIGQFYRESPGTHRIQIGLLRGSYVPEFRIEPLRRAGSATEVEPTELEPVTDEVTILGSPADPSKSKPRPGVSSRLPDWIKIKGGRGLVPLMFLILLGCAFVFLSTQRSRGVKGDIDLWSPFMHAGAPILICLDTHDFDTHTLQPSNVRQTDDGRRFVDLALRRQIISLDDAAILSSIASELGKRNTPHRVVGANEMSLADLRRQPVILIGAIDNRWTLLLTKELRYRIEVANPPGSGSNVEPIASIIDAQDPSMHAWTTDLSVPYAAWKNDYAVLARINDSATGVPVLIVAGLGNDGTVAATEMITSNSMMKTLANEASCKAKENFEAVIQTSIIDTKSGPPHVLRVTCW